MDELIFVPLEAHHIAQAEGWLQSPGVSGGHDDRELQWAALHDDELIAVANINFDTQHVGYLELVVKPSERRHGVAAQMLDYILAQEQVKGLSRLHAQIELDNIAAQKILSRHGFSNIGYSQEGLAEYERH